MYWLKFVSHEIKILFTYFPNSWCYENRKRTKALKCSQIWFPKNAKILPMPIGLEYFRSWCKQRGGRVCEAWPHGVTIFTPGPPRLWLVKGSQYLALIGCWPSVVTGESRGVPWSHYGAVRAGHHPSHVTFHPRHSFVTDFQDDRD